MSPDEKVALKRLYKTMFRDELDSIVAAKETEQQYAALAPAVRRLAKRRLDEVAALSSDYYVDHVGRHPSSISRERSAELTREALEFAVKRVDGRRR